MKTRLRSISAISSEFFYFAIYHLKIVFHWFEVVASQNNSGYNKVLSFIYYLKFHLHYLHSDNFSSLKQSTQVNLKGTGFHHLKFALLQ